MKERVGITKGLQHLDQVQTQVKQGNHETPVAVEPTQMRVQPPSLKELREWKESHRSEIPYLGRY